MNEPLHLFEEIAPAPDGGFYYYSISAPCSNNFERGHFLAVSYTHLTLPTISRV